MYKLIIFNDKEIKFAKIANNDIKFVSLKTILNNKDSFYPSFSLHIEERFFNLILKKLPFKYKVEFNIWYRDHNVRPSFLESLRFLVNSRFISENIKGTKLI